MGVSAMAGKRFKVQFLPPSCSQAQGRKCPRGPDPDQWEDMCLEDKQKGGMVGAPQQVAGL